MFQCLEFPNSTTFYPDLADVELRFHTNCINAFYNHKENQGVIVKLSSLLLVAILKSAITSIASMCGL